MNVIIDTNLSEMFKNIDASEIEHIPSLNSFDFLAILQSILRFEKAKSAIVPSPFEILDSFKQKTWKDLACSVEETQSIKDRFADMFSLEKEIVSEKELEEDFLSFAIKQFNIWKEGEQTVTFFTSGSTGIPKPCTHPESHLRQELVGIIPHFKKTKRALVTVPLHHLYGFTFGLLLPKALNIPLVSEAPFPQIIEKSLQEYDFLLAIPLLYEHLSRLEDLKGKNVFCISGTAPLQAEVFKTMLEKGFFMLENFGSSELGVMCSRLHPEHSFTLLPHFKRAENEKALVRTLPDKEELVCPIQDNLEWFDERHFLPRGRKDYAVQVGSVNVFPENIQKILSQHEGVKTSIVRLMRKEEGTRLKAFIVPEEELSEVSEKALRKSLRSYMLEKLTAPEIPQSITFGKELPLNLIGKPCDW